MPILHRLPRSLEHGVPPAAVPPARLNAGARRQVRRMSAGVLLFYVIDALLLTGYGSTGAVSPHLGWVYGLAGCGASALASACFWWRGGRSDELDALSLAQCLLASLLMLSTLGVAPRLGGMMLMSMMTVMALSALQLKGRVVVALCILLPAAGIAILWSTNAIAGVPTGTVAERFLTGLWLSWLMAKCSAHNIAGTELRTLVSDANAKLGEAFDALEKIAATDELTALPNRRTIQAELNHAIARMRQVDRSVTGLVGVALIDLDYFKRVNDRHGHDIGDQVLRVFSRLAANGLRPDDRVGRYGGEEFLLVFEQVRDAAAAAVAAERLRKSIESHDWSTVSPDLAVTVSIGVALVHRDEHSGAAIRRADAALYEAKRRGRNCVVLAQADLAAPAVANAAVP